MLILSLNVSLLNMYADFASAILFKDCKNKTKPYGISITINNQINADKVEREIESRALIYSSEDIYWRLSVIS